MADSVATAIEDFARWSPWLPFADACSEAPRLPGVYIAREDTDGPTVYVGMAGERSGKGLRGRLSVYRSGKAIASGLGEAVFDRALQDTAWLVQRLAEAEHGHARRATEWGRLAFARANLHISWATVADKAQALELEGRVITALAAHDLWNRRR